MYKLKGATYFFRTNLTMKGREQNLAALRQKQQNRKKSTKQNFHKLKKTSKHFIDVILRIGIRHEQIQT